MGLEAVFSPKGPWRMSFTNALHRAFTNARFKRLGLLPMEKLAFISSAVTINPAPLVVFEFFLPTRANTSGTWRTPSSSSEPKMTRTMSRNHSPAAMANGG